MREMELLFISMHYRPEPCDTRTSVLAREMARRGHRATALTSFPNYPFGKVYDGYRQRIWKREEIEGVRVVRVPMVPDHSRSVKRRALSYASFGAAATLLGPLLVGSPDLIWIHHPPLTTALAGWLISKVKRAPFVLEVHDLWPETLMSSGMVRESWVTRAIKRACAFLYRRAAAVVVTSAGMKEHLVQGGVEEGKVLVLPQWADEDAHNAARGEEGWLSEGFNVVYAGNVGAAQGLDTMLEAAEKLSDLPEVKFTIVGAGVELERLRSSAASRGLPNVRFFGQVSRRSAFALMSAADALILHLKRAPLFALTVPSKTQTYLLAGRPILCGVEGDASEIMARSHAGLTFEPENAESLAECVRALIRLPMEVREAMGANGLAAYRRQFSISELAGEYERLFEAVLLHEPGKAPRPAIEGRRAA